MNKYLINEETYAILPFDKKYSIIYEKNNEIKIRKRPTTIISNNCLLYGSSIDGRFKSTEYSTGITYKPPILLNDKSNSIFFPTASPRLNRCGWINLNSIKKIFKDSNNGTKIEFINNKIVRLAVSFNIINNQILKASRLEYILRQNKKNFY